jgi:hypothetical protein
MNKTSEYKVAVLLPTRGRTDALSRSVISLMNRAVDLDSVQLMLAFDQDDEVGQQHFESHLQPWLDEKGVNYTAMEFERLGYIRLNEYVNALALAADADWLMFWNDDAVMETTGWDRIIAGYTGKFKLLAVHTHHDHPYSIFPIAPRAWLDTLGYLSPHQISDCWLSQQAYLLDIWERIPVWVTHDRFDLTGNNGDDTFENRPMLEGDIRDPRDFHHLTWTARRLADTGKLANYMESQGFDASWWRDICSGQRRDPWQRLHENDVNNQVNSWKVTYDHKDGNLKKA